MLLLLSCGAQCIVGYTVIASLYTRDLQQGAAREETRVCEGTTNINIKMINMRKLGRASIYNRVAQCSQSQTQLLSSGTQWPITDSAVEFWNAVANHRLSC